jgi:hypothetical protein
MARIRLGDLTPLWVEGQPDSLPDPTSVYPQVPSLPADLADNFISGYTSAGTVPAYATSEQENPIDQLVTGGPYFVPSQPNNPAPFSGRQQTMPYRRTPILPDSILPEPLQRGSRILEHAAGMFSPTHDDLAILSESAMWRWIAEHGGLKSCCRISEVGAPFYTVAPWIQKPLNGIDYKKLFFQPLTAFQTAGVFNGTDTVIGQWRVDHAFDGVITKLVFGFTGVGFLQASAQIVWRLQYGQRYARDLGNVLNTYGDLQTALLVEADHIQLISDQTVTLYANIPAGSPVAGGQVFGGTFGWMWPRR